MKYDDAIDLAECLPMFFITCRPRSGSTWLRTMFDAHPSIVIPPECQFIINLKKKYLGLDLWTAKTVSSFIADLKKQGLIESWKIDWSKLRDTLLSNVYRVDYALACKLVYLYSFSCFEKGNPLAIGDKNPGYSFYSKELQEIFPEAKFIYLCRDYRENHISIVRAGFEMSIIAATCRKWVGYYELMKNGCENGNLIVCRYENLALSPENELKKLLGFIGVPYSPTMLDYADYAEDVKREYFTNSYAWKLHKNILLPPISNKPMEWGAHLTREEIAIADYVVGKTGEELGYKKVYGRPNVRVRAAAIFGVGLAKANFFARIFLDALPSDARSFVDFRLRLYIEKLMRVFDLRR
ncbi:MAG: sulfotransferase [Alcanivorax sp.]|nr:MAG: sulfotransferase [Alcanivorax sp.]